MKYLLETIFYAPISIYHVLIAVPLAVFLQRARYLAVALKGGLGAVLCFLLACFMYGFLEGFSFIHAYSPPGLEAALFSVYINAIYYGPGVFFVFSFITVVVTYTKRKKARQANTP